MAENKMEVKETVMNNKKGSAMALLPMAVFLGLYLVTSIITKYFYKMPVIIALIGASIVAFVMNPKESMEDKLSIFCKGAGNLDIIIMILIFILSGAFESVAKGMGAVESTVNFELRFLSSSILIVGVFVISGFISLSIGTSIGTIAAIAPIALGICQKIGINPALALGAVVGGLINNFTCIHYNNSNIISNDVRCKIYNGRCI